MKTDFAILQDDKTKLTRIYRKDFGWSDPLPESDWEILSELHKAMRNSDPQDFMFNLGIAVDYMKKDDLEG